MLLQNKKGQAKGALQPLQLILKPLKLAGEAVNRRMPGYETRLYEEYRKGLHGATNSNLFTKEFLEKHGLTYTKLSEIGIMQRDAKDKRLQKQMARQQSQPSPNPNQINVPGYTNQPTYYPNQQQTQQPPPQKQKKGKAAAVGQFFTDTAKGQTEKRHIILAAIVSILGIGLAMSGQSSLIIDVLFFIFLIITLHTNLKTDWALIIVAVLEIGASLSGITPIRTLPEVLRNVAFNPLMPWWLVYTVLKSGGKGGKLPAVLYVITVTFLIGLAYFNISDQQKVVFGYDLTTGGRLTTEQIETAREIAGQGGKGALQLVKDTVTTTVGGISGFFNARIQEAGGEELFGEPKERPKLGIVIQEHPSKSIEFGDNTIVKAILLLPNLPEQQEYMEVEDITCTAEGAKPVKAKEFREGMKIFYNSPITVTCEFPTNDIEKASSVEMSVKYHFRENAKLITYIMRADLLDELRTKREDPLDFMAVPNSKRHPTTIYDNGAAKIGIGPAELLAPPFRIENGLTYPHFEFVVGNKPDFQGVISRINSIDLTMPEGFSLKADECAFRAAGGNTYTAAQAIKQYEKKFTTIPTSKYFLCNMEIGEDSLRSASFAEIEFDANVDFTYETKKQLSLN